MPKTINEKSASDIICESCGKDFSCGVETGKCWCFDVEVTSDNLESLKKDFKQCLCPNCLENYTEKK